MVIVGGVSVLADGTCSPGLQRFSRHAGRSDGQALHEVPDSYGCLPRIFPLKYIKKQQQNLSSYCIAGNFEGSNVQKN